MPKQLSVMLELSLPTIENWFVQQSGLSKVAKFADRSDVIAALYIFLEGDDLANHVIMSVVGVHFSYPTVGESELPVYLVAVTGEGDHFYSACRLLQNRFSPN